MNLSANIHYRRLFLIFTISSSLTAAWELARTAIAVELRLAFILAMLGSLLIFGQQITSDDDRNKSAETLLLTLVAIYVIVVLRSTVQLSDEGHFANFASNALAEGMNPYFRLPIDQVAGLQPDPNSWTFRMDGTHVQQFSYPVFALAIYWCLGLIVGHTSLAVVGSLVALVGSVYLIRRGWGNFSALLFVGIWFTPMFQALVSSGNTDFLLVPPLVMIASLLKRGESADALRISLLLSLIVCLKQTAWLMAPILILAASTNYQCARAKDVDWLRFRRITVLTFAFSAFANFTAGLFFGFKTYWKAVMQPISSALVPNGIGMADLVRSYGVSNIKVISFVSMVGFCLLFYFATRLGCIGRFNCAVASTLLPLFSHRGFLSYATAITPVLLCAPIAPSLLTYTDRFRKSHLRYTAIAVALATASTAVMVCFVSLLSPSGKLLVSHMEYNSQYGKLVSFQLRGIGLKENLDQYSYFVEGGRGLSAPWLKGAITSGTLTLFAPNQWAGTDVSDGFRVIATNPRTKMVRVAHVSRFPTLVVNPIGNQRELRVHKVVILKFRLAGSVEIKGRLQVALSQLGLKGFGVRTGVLRLDQGGIGGGSRAKRIQHDGIVSFTAECTQTTTALQVVHMVVRTVPSQPLRIHGEDLTFVCR